MAFLVIAIILGVVALGGIGAIFFATYDDSKALGAIVAVVATVLCIGCVIGGKATTVSANHVGVVTQLGSYKGQLDSGFSWKGILESVEEIPTRTQLVTQTDVSIRFSGNSGGNADITVGWHAAKGDEQGIKKLWETYKTRESIENDLVKPNARNALNQATAQFEPGAGVSGASLPQINGETQRAIAKLMEGKGVIVDTITVSDVQPDPNSQDRINKQVAALADQQTAKTEFETAKIQRDTAGIRNQTQSQSSLAYECLLTAKNWNAEKQGQMPLVWNCLGGDVGDVNINAPAPVR